MCPPMCICVAVHAFGSRFVSLHLLVCFYLLVSVGVIGDMFDNRRTQDKRGINSINQSDHPHTKMHPQTEKMKSLLF